MSGKLGMKLANIVLIEVTVPYDNQRICMPMKTVSCHINFSPFPMLIDSPKMTRY